MKQVWEGLYVFHTAIGLTAVFFHHAKFQNRTLTFQIIHGTVFVSGFVRKILTRFWNGEPVSSSWKRKEKDPRSLR